MKTCDDQQGGDILNQLQNDCTRYIKSSRKHSNRKRMKESIHALIIYTTIERSKSNKVLTKENTKIDGIANLLCVPCKQ